MMTWVRSNWIDLDYIITPANVSYGPRLAALTDGYGVTDNVNVSVTRQNGLVFHVKYSDGTYRTAITPAARVVDSTWHHVAVTYNRFGKLKLYVDGVLASETVSYDKDFYNLGGYGLNQIHIGGFTGSGTNFDGTLDDWRLYRYELSARQIKDIFDGTVSSQSISSQSYTSPRFSSWLTSSTSDESSVLNSTSSNTMSLSTVTGSSPTTQTASTESSSGGLAYEDAEYYYDVEREDQSSGITTLINHGRYGSLGNLPINTSSMSVVASAINGKKAYNFASSFSFTRTAPVTPTDGVGLTMAFVLRAPTNTSIFRAAVTNAGGSFSA
jgi:hypothetical protein